MPEPILLLRLEGPLQSWGVRARWDVRDTAHEPTKSGVVGLLACARGLARDDAALQTMHEALRFGVRVERAGTLITDYQTITDYIPSADGKFRVRGESAAVSGPVSRLIERGSAPSTIISPRAYLEDAAFLAALEAKDGEDAARVLAECAAAVQAPHWTLFLGRKSCVPTRPIFEYFGDDYQNIDDAFAQHPWSWSGAANATRAQKPRADLVAFIEDETGPLSRHDARQQNASRLYGFRNVRQAAFAPILAEVRS